MKNLPLMYFEAKPPKLLAQLAIAQRFQLSCDILDLIEDDAGRLVYPEQPYEGSQEGDEGQQLPIGAWKAENVMVFDTFRSKPPRRFRGLCDWGIRFWLASW